VFRHRQFEKHVFTRLQNDRSDGVSLMAGGRLFQARAAATGNARSCSMAVDDKWCWWCFPNSQLSCMLLHSPKRNIFNYLTDINL